MGRVPGRRHPLHGIFKSSFTSEWTGVLLCRPRNGVWARVGENCKVVMWANNMLLYNRHEIITNSPIEALGVLYWLRDTGGKDEEKKVD